MYLLYSHVQYLAQKTPKTQTSYPAKTSLYFFFLISGLTAIKLGFYAALSLVNEKRNSTRIFYFYRIPLNMPLKLLS